MAADMKEALMDAPTMDATVQKLKKGAQLCKVRGVKKQYMRFYRVDVETMRLLAESKKWWSVSESNASDGRMETAGGNLLAQLSCVGPRQMRFIEVALVDVAEVREGWKTDIFNKMAGHVEKNKKADGRGESPLDENRCFSIIYGNNGRDTLDLVAESREERDTWLHGLQHLVETFRSLHQDRQYDMWLRSKFEAADKDGNGALKLSEVVSLLGHLNLQCDQKHVKKLFNDANTNKCKRDGEQVLDGDEFVAFYHALLKMPLVERLFHQYGNEKSGTMSSDQLREFMSAEQQTHLTDEAAKQLIQQCELSNARTRNLFTLDGFYHLLLSPEFNVYNNDHQSTVHQDMTQPLSHYFISSSHNTYLTGNQLTGESSVEGYISALKRGCRVVELDVWDGDDGDPIIYHGHTLTSKISLADVLKDAIKLYAFHSSDYPVMLSVENHLSIPQQQRMVKLMKEILGDALLTATVAEGVTELPSPELLKHKIIVKTKKPQGTEVESDDEPDDDQDTIDYIDSEDGAHASKTKPHKPLAPELAQIVNVCEGKKFVSLESSLVNDKCYHFPSLRENKARELYESCPADFVRFTQRQLAKIYPLGTRTSSSNLKPYPFWSVGAQVVTLNMQTADKATFYNEALFRSNGGCGYVLKPAILRGLHGTYDPDNLDDSMSRVLRVRLLSGQHLPASDNKGDIVDPYVQLKVRGHPLDKQKQRSAIVKNNGFNPVWDEMLEVRVRVPAVAMLYFSVRDESSMSRDAVLALAAIPFTSLRTGYGHVHLTDLTGKLLAPSALFVHISISAS